MKFVPVRVSRLAVVWLAFVPACGDALEPGERPRAGASGQSGDEPASGGAAPQNAGTSGVFGGAAGKAGAPGASATSGSSGASGASGLGGNGGGRAGASSSAGSGGAARGGAAGAGGEAGSSGGGAGGRAGSGNGGDTAIAGSDGEGGAPTTDEEIPPGYVKGIVAVGYGGLRVVSRDNGQRWEDAVDFGDANADDQNLLRAVVYGKGRWIATGWRLLYSDDGVEWTQHSMVRDQISDQAIIEGLAYANGYFYAAGDPGKLYRSADGLSWERYGSSIGDTEKHTALAFRGGVFVAYGDSHTSFQSTDGTSWTQLSVRDATFCEGQWRTLEQCHDAAWFDGGFYLRAEWGGQIQRSPNGSGFKSVYDDPDEHTAYKSFTFAEGYVAP